MASHLRWPMQDENFRRRRHGGFRRRRTRGIRIGRSGGRFKENRGRPPEVPGRSIPPVGEEPGYPHAAEKNFFALRFAPSSPSVAPAARPYGRTASRRRRRETASRRRRRSVARHREPRTAPGMACCDVSSGSASASTSCETIAASSPVPGGSAKSSAGRFCSRVIARPRAGFRPLCRLRVFFVRRLFGAVFVRHRGRSCSKETV